MKKRAGISLILFLMGLLLQAQPSSFRVAVDRNTILIGEPIQLSLRGTTGPGGGGEWVRVDTLPHFEILHQSGIDTVRRPEGLDLSQTVTLTSWDSGRWAIPSFSFGGKKSKPVFVTVSYSAFDPAQEYHDIKDIIEVEKEPRTVWYWYVLLALLVLGLAALMFPSPRKGGAEPALPAEPVFKRTMARLETLKRKAGTTEVKEYYSELTEVFRTYLDQRKGLRSQTRTTTDLVGQLTTLSLEPSAEARLIAVLEESDLVKFAKYLPPVSQREAALQTIKEAIVAIEET